MWAITNCQIIDKSDKIWYNYFIDSSGGSQVVTDSQIAMWVSEPSHCKTDYQGENIMSKPMIIRVVFSVLIALALVAGIYTSVRGAAVASTGIKSGQAHVNLGLQSSRSFTQNSASFSGMPAGFDDEGGHDCRGSESSVDPSDD